MLFFEAIRLSVLCKKGQRFFMAFIEEIHLKSIFLNFHKTLVKKNWIFISEFESEKNLL